MTRSMHRFALFAVLLLAATADAGTIQEALNDPGRPNSDREDDGRRHPVEVMTFAGVTGGEVILEIGAGRGYTTELVSRMVGKGGKVFAHQISPDRLIGNRLPNVIVIPNEPEDFAARLTAAGVTAGSVDRVLAFFSLHDGYEGPPEDMLDLYAALLKVLKPNGVLVVCDNTATPGSGLASVPGLHRIDEAYMKNEILKAGFELEAESDVLRNPDDDLESSWFEDTETRKAGYQDRFTLRFRKK
ncbi:MAG: methyltransferase domain-containing protein [Gammaproteobacteria bacterium]|nr:methyltransferase domain-containing protein [Gammaproteobacteria bacterium]MDH5304998.1 methyltransferase domain-containing protein [Gammaproteobacteria bacterium]MDH5321990.1 methyltransferase domain-containing protein [Gammaproteobacteria bacterium]